MFKHYIRLKWPVPCKLTTTFHRVEFALNVSGNITVYSQNGSSYLKHNSKLSFFYCDLRYTAATKMPLTHSTTAYNLHSTMLARKFNSRLKIRATFSASRLRPPDWYPGARIQNNPAGNTEKPRLHDSETESRSWLHGPNMCPQSELTRPIVEWFCSESNFLNWMHWGACAAV